MAPVSPFRRMVVGARNTLVRVGQSVRGCLMNTGQWVRARFARLLGLRRRGGTTADNTNNGLNLQRPDDGSNVVVMIPNGVGNILPANPGNDPNNNALNLQRQGDNNNNNNARGNSLKGHSIISKLICGANLVLIVGIVFLQVSEPKHPYGWITIAELSIQSPALVSMMMGFYVGEPKLSAAMCFHRTGHVLFLEGIAVAAVYRFNWPLQVIPLVLLPVPAVLLPIVRFPAGN
ncbi:hypothetical protein Cgig2_016800 [Carnegiea gigantea]|uniref:Uncharacterized protein n=1 Tax=Carnegiea gigantea TaxID=171969 RepID=A0A9Q1GWG3_9CARY|nr:hypothetical protein Cgig2_016800 [Carnegiea gigantea]